MALLLGAFYGGLVYGRTRWFDEGYNAGFHEGNQTGHVSGYETGYEDGRSHGWEYGWITGKNQGYEEGYTEGENVGYDKGYDDGTATGHEDGYNEGYSVGYLEGFAETGWTIRDPTYSEMRVFLRDDETDTIEYEEIYFDCDDFAATVKQNAFDQGYRCFLVYLEFTEGGGHALVAFETKDRGMKYVEPQSDEIMEVEIGEHYWNYDVPYDDTIVTPTLVP